MKPGLFYFLICFICFPSINFASEPIGDGVFRLYLNKVNYGEIPIVYTDSTLLIGFDQLLLTLGYPYTLNAGESRFSVCYKTDDCFFISPDSASYRGQAIPTRDLQALYYNGGLFLPADVISKYSPFHFSIHSKSLSIYLVSEDVTPVELKQDVERQKESRKKKGVVIIPVDTLHYKRFRVNNLGYTVSGSFSEKGASDWIFRTGLTGELLNGYYTINYLYQPKSYYQRNDLTFDWCNPLIGKKWLKQIHFSRNYNDLMITAKGYSTGIRLSNRPSTDNLSSSYRYESGSVANADIDLFQNNQYITTVRSANNGLITGNMTLLPGMNRLSSVYYDDYYRPVMTTREIYMPYGFTPEKSFLYTVGAGYTDDNKSYVQARLSYGLTYYLTFFSDIDALWDRHVFKQMTSWGVKYAFRDIFKGELSYAPGVRVNAAISGSLFNRLNYSLFAERYNRRQKVILFNSLDKVSFALNIRTPFLGRSGYLNLNAMYYKYLFGINFITNAQWYLYWSKFSGSVYASTQSDKVGKLSNLIYGGRLGYQFNSNSGGEVYFEHNNRFRDNIIRTRYRYQLNNLLYVNVGADYTVRSNNYNFTAGFSYYLPWTQIQNTFNFSNRNWNNATAISGSLLFSEDGNVSLSNRYSAGASLHIIPFLDTNGNGSFDDDEPVMKDAVVNVRAGGQSRRTSKGIFMSGIPPYMAFQIVVPRQTFQDISWQVDQKTYAIVLLPYENRTMEIPIKIISEIYGRVLIERKNGASGASDAVINFRNMSTGKSFSITTDNQGYYHHVGLTPGTYEIKLSDIYLSRKGLKAMGEFIKQIHIDSGQEGQQLEDIDFRIQKVE